jgi:PAS domain S-box-containing protein
MISKTETGKMAKEVTKKRVFVVDDNEKDRKLVTELLEDKGYEVVSAAGDVDSGEALRLSEEKFHRIVEDQTEFIVRWKPDGTRTFANKSYCDYYGLSPEEAIGTSFFPLISETDRENVRKRVESLTPGNPVSTAVHGVVQPDGSEGWNEWTDRAFFDPEGNIAEYQSTGRDITDRKKAEIALEASEYKYRMLAENASDVIWTMDMDQRYTYISPSVMEMRGFTPKEASELSFEDVLTPESLEILRKSLAREQELEKQGRLGPSNISSHELEMYRKDGSTLWTEIRVRTLRDPDGSPTGLLGVTRDISERKNAEESLALEKTFSDEIINSLPGVFYLHDEEGRLVRWNRKYEEISGYSAEELYNKHSLDLFDGEDKAVIESALESLWTEGEFVAEAFVTIKGGEKIPFHFSSRVINLGDKPYFLGVALDISERKQAEKVLRATQYSIDTSGTAILWVRPDTTSIIYANNAACRHLGYTRDQLLTMTVPDIDPNWTMEYHQTGGQEVLSSENPVMFESRHIRRDGTIVPVEISLSHLEFEGEKYYFVFVTDITVRKEAEKALRATQHSIHTSEIVLLWITPDARLAYVNDAACRFFGYTREKLLTMGVPDIDPDWSKEYWISEGWERVKSAGKSTFESRNWDMDGRIVPVEVSTSYFEFEGEEYIFAFITDITERKEAEEDLIKSRRTLQELTNHLQSIREKERSYVAREIHDELGQSLTAIKFDVSALRGRLKERADTEKINSLLETIDETMRVARRLSTEMRPSILDDFGLSESVQWLAADFSERSSIECDVTIDPPEIRADSERSTAVFRVMQEALTNVYRHSEAKRAVVGLSESEGFLHLEVMDDGKGISTGEIEGQRSFGIIGMKERARALGGRLDLIGSPGKGTSVRLTIPAGGN